MNETNIVRLCLVAASQAGARLFRHNAGMAWAGRSTRTPDGTVTIKNARPFHGVVEGHPDTGGFVPTVITEDMVGQTFARAVYVEVKTDKGRASKQQLAFIEMARSMGALAGIARGPDDVRAILDGEVRD